MALQTVKGSGAFTREQAAIINSNFAAVTARTPDLWVRPQNGGLDTNPGTFEKPLATIAGTSKYIEAGIVIGVEGVLTEEFSGPNVADVTIVGYNSNQPRQATTSGAANGGGATWLSPSGGTSHLLTINGQAWTVANMYFNNSATAAACVRLMVSGTGDPPADPDASHAQLLGCVFTGSDDGVTSSGLPNFVTIQGCTFFNFTGSGDTALSYAVGAGLKTLLGWEISYNWFYNNVHNIVAGFSGANIHDNTFTYVGNSVTSTSLLNLTGGGRNQVWKNKFGLASNTTGIGTTIIIGATDDSWGPNFYSDAEEYSTPTS